MIYFYDTCALLNGDPKEIFAEPFVISNITCQSKKSVVIFSF